MEAWWIWRLADDRSLGDIEACGGMEAWLDIEACGCIEAWVDIEAHHTFSNFSYFADK